MDTLHDLSVPAGNSFKGTVLTAFRQEPLSATVLNCQMRFQTGTDQTVNRPQPKYERHIQKTVKTAHSHLYLYQFQPLFFACRLVT